MHSITRLGVSVDNCALGGAARQRGYNYALCPNLWLGRPSTQRRYTLNVHNGDQTDTDEARAEDVQSEELDDLLEKVR
jgi:hypothetical protein